MPVDLNFVAHQDDDILFMQPDIINSYIGGSVGQVTVYLTCGNDEQWNDWIYIRRREQGAMDAYAHMAQIKAGKMGEHPGSIHWTVSRENYGPLAATQADCIDYPDLHLIFLRFSGCECRGRRWTEDFQRRPVAPVNSLEDLWDGACTSLAPVDQSGDYDKSTLNSGLTAILEAWAPRIIRCMDMGQPPAQSTDHPDHYYSALFAQQAIEAYRATGNCPPGMRQSNYRGYDISNDPENVFGTEHLWKQWLFYYYSCNDPHLASVFDPLKPPPNPKWPKMPYSAWLRRQYICNTSG